MKRFISILRLFFLVVCLQLWACNDALDKTPLDRFSDDAVWVDKDLINAFVSNTYRLMPIGFSASSHQRLAGVSDESYQRGDGGNFINLGNITPSSLGVLDSWTGATGFNYWSVITNCNIFFARIDQAPVDAAIKSRMVGEMKFLRAHAYFKLVAFFGGVPLITQSFALTDDFNVPRNTYDECMAFVVKELDESAGLLPLKYDAANMGRITKGAALAIKARALLYMASPLNNPANDTKKWQDAANAAKAVIDLNQYSLFPDYKELFLKKNSYNQEVIWSRGFDYSVDPQAVRVELSQYPNGYGGFGQTHPLHNIVNDYELTSGKLPKDDPAYDPQKPYINRDPRFYASILYDGAPFQGRPVETFLPGGKDSNEGALSGWNATLTGYYLRKFMDETIINPSDVNQGNSPWIFIRYAEVLLNYAEAMYHLGNEAVSREYVNMIRKRESVKMPPVTESGNELLLRIQNERRIELAFEEHRWFDVRRWKIAPVKLNEDAMKMTIIRAADGSKTYTTSVFNIRNFYDKNYLVPIPQSEIDKNPLLKQNPGY
ncbi:RagB/SusD family nutrient uptake outer membrane protein [Dyadobacter helix]|nr:RagB/SusD family nutrient uptake outer membrane protein [Dyadobacter sp. CECT 9275]